MASTAFVKWLARTSKRVLPRFLHPLVSGLYVRNKLRYQKARDYVERDFYRLTGRSYLQWYANRMDRLAITDTSPESLEWMRTTGREDLDILIGLGLKPHHTLHEFGVGYIRCAAWFIDYLEPGKFSGNDTSGNRIQAGLNVHGRERILAKKPLLITNRDNSFEWLDGRKVDFVWSHAVFSHMPDSDVEFTIKSMRRIMHPGTKAYLTYSQHHVLRDDEKNIPQTGAKDFQRSLDWYQRIAATHGYNIEELDFRPGPVTTWGGGERLLCLTLKA